ncbi:PXA domain-containing protein [Hypoxylon trugodes]|uniref:PXA domain-containing protein n=1 Tax=Hypoxylon trugodes TaxID=326681 RepID=UPI0021985CFE|nr:PXA domain-containing protein [Hypoxylon trugodes]KAI1389763.1 PXA domain-containing protein [Hypoxylon trugodes]
MNTVDDAQSGAVPAVSQDETKSNSSSIETRPVGKIQSRPISPTQQDIPTSTSTRQDIVTKALQFLSTATPNTLGAIAIGLAATTYFILGQIGLVLIGAFAGITLFATWESRHPEVSRAVRGERGYDLLDRILATSKPGVGLGQDDGNNEQSLIQTFEDFRPETRQALNALVDAVIRDYVDWWYGPIVPSDRSFPFSCRRVLVNFVLSISNQLGRKRPADAFVDFLTHTCSIIIVFLSEMASAYSELPSDTNLTAADAIYNYLASNTEAPLSNLLNQRQQAGKFKMVAEDLLGFLDKSAYDCDPARVFLREILSTIVLEGTLQTCSKAEWINAWIVYLLESGETDLSQAIDDAIQDQKAFGDVDGNVGNIGLSRGNRNSYEMDRARRKEATHKKQLSKADEEMERAMEEMKRLNEMIAEADKTNVVPNLPNGSQTNAPGLLNNALEKNGKELDLKINEKSNGIPPEKPKSADSNPRVMAGEARSGKAENKEEQLKSPISLKSPTDTSTHVSSPSNGQVGHHNHRFTSFDQIVPPATEEPEESDSHNPPPLTLHNATITIHDDTTNDKGRLRGKPTWEFLLQIEPATSHYPGWMLMKTYVQFENLHESLRRIATISGSTAFLEAFAVFPSWKVHTRSSLRGEIERYMRTACAEKSLAESEAFKRFLDKGQETRMGTNRGFSFESMGKGMLDAIQNAPKGALDGGKVVVGGVTGVFGNIGLGPRKSTNSSLSELQTKEISKTQSPSSARPLSMSALPRMDSVSSINGSGKSRDSLDSQQSSVISVQPGKMAPMERRPSYQVDMDQDSLHPARADRWERNSVSATSSRVHSRASSAAALRSPVRSPSELSFTNIKLPPPPDEITDDYGSPTSTRLSVDGNSRFMSTNGTSPVQSSNSNQQGKLSQASAPIKRPSRQYAPLSEQETRVAVELLFAVINELYTLSSAWNIRRTLLTAAKSFLLRPGNPSLISIQSLVQESVLEANTSDSSIATYLRKLRENSMPTEEERNAWPKEMTTEEKEELRVKARKLFIQSGVPAALMGIMGQSATSEALGRVFDCLQIEEVARGLFFGVMLQAVRVVTH